jgi:hypothetical protein
MGSEKSKPIMDVPTRPVRRNARIISPVPQHASSQSPGPWEAAMRQALARQIRSMPKDTQRFTAS